MPLRCKLDVYVTKPVLACETAFKSDMYMHRSFFIMWSTASRLMVPFVSYAFC